ncbi:hypothetical protein [Archaeoglobus sp.]
MYLASYLNSTLSIFLTCVIGRYNFGQGLLELATIDSKKLFVLDPDKLSKDLTDKIIDVFKKLAQREIRSIFEELGLPKPKKDFSNINPEDVKLENIMPDRRELDKIIFEALGLSEEEQLEVYKAVVELVKWRLAKAKSV